MRIPEPIAALVRLVAGFPVPVRPEAGTGVEPPANRDDENFELLGTFTILDSQWLLDRFQKAGVRFQVDVDTSNNPSGSKNFIPIERSTIGVYVHKNDWDGAQQIVTELQTISLGKNPTASRRADRNHTPSRL